MHDKQFAMDEAVYACVPVPVALTLIPSFSKILHDELGSASFRHHLSDYRRMQRLIRRLLFWQRSLWLCLAFKLYKIFVGKTIQLVSCGKPSDMEQRFPNFLVSIRKKLYHFFRVLRHTTMSISRCMVRGRFRLVASWCTVVWIKRCQHHFRQQDDGVHGCLT